MKENRMFTLERMDTGSKKYYVTYSFEPLDSDSTRFKYYEWTEDARLDDVFPLKHLEKLKSILEEKQS